uniref:Protein turtle homolog A-like n=1 Tax=Fundulus heteroclitus TaxID=8078 RepID=A0A3Q2NUM7_FUNHE
MYDLRLMSRSNKALSEPSDSVSVSTEGMDIYPLRPGFLEVIPQPLMAGVIGGACFLFLAIILSVVTACYMSNRRRRRRRKRRQDLPAAIQKSPSQEPRSPPRSPDSVLKFKLCPPLPFFPNSSSSQYDRSSFDKGSRGEYHDQRRQLLSNSSPPPHYTLFESHLGSQAPSPTALESISRGPDGRFIVQPLPEGSSPSTKNKIKKDALQGNGSVNGSGSNRTSIRDSPKSSILSSEKDERKESPLTVDVPELSRPPASPGRVRAMARNFSRHGCFYSDDEQGSESLLERASFYSDNSERKPSDSLRRCRMQGNSEDLFSSLGRKTRLLDRDRPHQGGYQPMESTLTDDSTLVSQLETDSVTKCVQLAKEREEIERELKNFTTGQRHRSRAREEPSPSRKTEPPQREEPKSAEDPVWKPQEVTIRQKYKPSAMTSRVSDYRRACYFGNTSSPLDRLPTSRIQWDISPVTSVSSLIHVQTPHQETTSPSREAAEESLTLNSSRSPVTQNTSLPSLSPDTTPDRAKPSSPQKKQETCSNLAEETQRRRSPLASQLRRLATIERPESSASVQQSQTERRDPGPCSSSILRYDHQKVGAKSKDRESQGTSGFYAELEREGVRTRSRRSDKCLFPDSLSPVSTLTLVEEVEVDQSQFSAPRMSDSFKAEPAAPSPKMSPHQTSAILEYLSLPGFIEMSVDEPAEEVQGANTSERGSEQKPEEDSVVAKPDVVPRNWEVHVQENKETASGEKQAAPLGAAPCSFDASKRQGSRRSPHVETRVRFPDDPTPSSSAPEPTSRALYDEKTRTRAGNICTGRLESRLGSRSSHALFSAAKSVADIVSKHSQGYLDSEEFSPEQPQRQASQGSRTNKIVSRITQAPVPFLKKSLSLGPCRTLSGVAQPRPYLKKSISLGSQRWEHFETPRTYISEKCFWDEFPSPDVRVKSYSLGRTPPSLPPPGPCWREYVPFRRPSMGSLERPHHAPRSLASPSYLTPMYPPRQTSVSPMLEPSDPRRQAAIFPESSRWCPSYQDTLRPVQHQYVSNLPYYQDWPDPRGESLRHLDARIGPPRSYLPRGISWPSPYYAAFPPREGDSYRHPDRMMGRGGDADVREGGRASFASQSSGRGSAGLFRQSLSITPTLLSSPETTEEHERLRAEMELAKRRVKRRNTSVDESYEWDSADACLDPEVLEATRPDQSPAAVQRGRGETGSDQTGGLRDQRQKGPPPPVIPARSLSEARFNALRLEYQEYRRAQGPPRALEPRFRPGHDSDSDSSSALL